MWIAASLFLFSCHEIVPLNTTPLDNSGMSFVAIQTLKKMNLAATEVPQIAEARSAGLPDDDCIALVRLLHSRHEKFDLGDNVAQLLRSGISSSMVMQLAQLGQIKPWGVEAVAMHLAGLSDEIILQDARRRAAGLPVLSGASLANLKNTGMREYTLLQLVRRGVADSQASTILTLRRRGWSDAQILRRYR